MPSSVVPQTADFRALFESLPDSYLALAPDLTVVAASDAYLRALGLERGQILGRALPDLLTVDRSGREVRASLDRVLASGRVDLLRLRGYGLGSSGKSAAFRVVHSPVYGDSGEIAYLLQRLEADAEPEEEGARRDFLADLAHDLRNPLAPIVNSLHIARLPNVSDEQRERLRELTERQVQQLTRKIDDLLDVSRLTSGKVALQWERLDLADLVRSVVSSLSGLGEGALARGTRFTLDLPERPLWTRADRARLTQAVSNLLENACASTEPGGEIAVGLAFSASHSPNDGNAGNTGHVSHAGNTGNTSDVGDAGTAVLTVRSPCDPGIGPEEDLRGRGLGLALVKSLVEVHGGTIDAANEGPGAGSTITLRLPLAPTREEPAPAAVLRPRRILIVEDNVDAAESLRLFLELTGHAATVAHNGMEAVARARDTQPEVVLCDIGLPGDMDGYAVARALRHDPELSFTRLIALTGYGQAEDRRLASEAGFDLHLTKPTDPEALLRVLGSFF